MSKPEKKNKKIETEKKNKPSKENKKKEVKKTKTPKNKKPVSKNKGVKKVKRIHTEGITSPEVVKVAPIEDTVTMRKGEFEVNENKAKQEKISEIIQKSKALETLKNDPIIQKVEIYNELKNEKKEENELTNQLVKEYTSNKKPNWFKRILEKLRDIYS